MKNDIHTDPYDAQGWRMMFHFCVGGLVLMALGFGLPHMTAELGASGEGSVGRLSWLTVGMGLVFLLLGGLSGLFLGPYLQVKQKYGTGGAVMMFAPGILLAAALIAVALK